MIHSKYSGMIQCMKCGKNFKSKVERGQQKYLCSGYERYGKVYCEREVISETILDELIELHFRKKLDAYETRNRVKNIEIHKDKWVINYYEGEPTIRTRTFLQI